MKMDQGHISKGAYYQNTKSAIIFQMFCLNPGKMSGGI